MLFPVGIEVRQNKSINFKAPMQTNVYHYKNNMMLSFQEKEMEAWETLQSSHFEDVEDFEMSFL